MSTYVGECQCYVCLSNASTVHAVHFSDESCALHKGYALGMRCTEL